MRILTKKERKLVYALFRRKGINHVTTIDKAGQPVHLPLSTLTQAEIVDRVPRLIGSNLAQFLENSKGKII
jgi:hypothetical protein